jgi:hypothetical protein
LNLSRALAKDNRVPGLTLSSRPSEVSRKVLFVLYRYVMPLEIGFSLEKEEEFKQGEARPYRR